ncbi:ABC transporter permease [Candidatus Portiera aleyrodidarum MED (Bemisia tabaci)]|uniref:ABC transporter permease n=2 Tax=Candidatus Portiera aleyrodidarum TaxID=91844 RepID=A0AAU8RQP7_9GAMM|nr:ABC-type transport system involved in Fe-S cluster assembly, permease component [Candidatus Portiera aleyrodidarum BT-B-HRs]AFS18789.1 FeS cluster assembly protein sufD [Candidatus Portiera aleyrodidarum BT-QVLC]AJF24002.1 ABC transporter permease [Candidatus Portiera aleyrodidarum MED (Bemisia tabaci)]AUI73145.1 ABC transporter permease [Candidatus Portiera aleyrodidarum]AFT80415.1 Iron-sulfur cluster assembly protein SufD [Candidatus Portiera aleyrodidarum BT-QVLC]
MCDLLNIDAYMIVFIDGKLSKKYSNVINSCEVNIIYLKNNLMNKETDKIKKKYYTYSGLILNLKSNIKIKKPIYMLHISKQKIYKQINLKILVLVEKKLKIQILEHYINKSSNKHINNIKMEMNISDEAKITWFHLVALNTIDYCLSNIVVNLSKYSNCEFYNIKIYSYFLYYNLEINLKDEYSKCDVVGLFSPKDKNFIRNNIIINHITSFTKSNVNYKGLISSTGLLHCYINIKKNIKNIYGIQKSSNILLSNKATIKTNPKLKIKSKDVVCTHKTIVGKINEDYIFYLRTRGLTKPLAKSLILLSFINDFLTKIEIKAFKRYLGCTKIIKLKDAYRQ